VTRAIKREEHSDGPTNGCSLILGFIGKDASSGANLLPPQKPLVLTNARPGRKSLAAAESRLALGRVTEMVIARWYLPAP